MRGAVGVYDIGICDDGEFTCSEIEEMLLQYEKKHMVKLAVHIWNSGEQLCRYLKNSGGLDLIFLDIRMNGTNGMDVARILRSRNYKGYVIFVTVMEELVFDSFEVQAFDYFVKPVNHERFHKTMERLLSDMQNSSETNLFIQRGNEWSIIPFDDIMYCEIINRKIYLHLERQEVIDFYEKIENMEKKLDNRFFKCHRSYIINLKYVRNYKKDTAYLCNGEEIPVSRLRNEEFTNAILQYMKEWRF